MEIFRTMKAISCNSPSVVALGTFDGIHIGHQEIMNRLLRISQDEKLIPTVYTFSDHPLAQVAPDRVPPQIIDVEHKESFIGQMGIKQLVMVPFDVYQRTIEPEAFIRDVLIGMLKMEHIVIGEDVKFGYQGLGDRVFLEELADKYGFKITVVPAIKMGDVRISSTMIRGLLLEGRIREANLFLGRKHSVVGTVVEGKKLGRTIGVPTANLKISRPMSTIRAGVYITETMIEGIKYQSVTNVGFNPTFNQKSLNLETHILDYDDNLYTKSIEVFFIHRLRDEMKFNNVDDLIIQMIDDIAQTRIYFNSSLYRTGNL